MKLLKYQLVFLFSFILTISIISCSKDDPISNEKPSQEQPGGDTDNGGGNNEPNETPAGDIEIKTAQEFIEFARAVNSDPSKEEAKLNGVLAYQAHVVQKADIDLTGLDWYPIGGKSYYRGEGDGSTEMISYFAGIFDGNGFKISGMKIIDATTNRNGVASHAGLFGRLSNPIEGYTILTNIKLVNADIKLDNYDRPHEDVYAGILVGYIATALGRNPAIISNCSVQGKISIANRQSVSAGGLIGETILAHLTGCTTDVSIITNASGNIYTGGITGRSIDTNIASSYSKNSITAKSSGNESIIYAGGSIGMLHNNEYYSSQAMALRSDGNVIAEGTNVYAGGLLGRGGNKIIGCIATGQVTAPKTENCYYGAIAGSGIVLGLCYGTGTVGEGNSNIVSSERNIVYNSSPADGEILSIVSNSNNSTLGGFYTTFVTPKDGKFVFEVSPSLWVLFDDNVWTSSTPGDTKYPMPVISYKGQRAN